MRATLISYGTTGDVRPMVALALGLRSAGHEVNLVGDEGGAELATRHRFDFHALDGPLRDLMAPGGALADSFERGRVTLAALRAHRYPDEEWLATMEEAAAGSDLVVGMPVAGYHAGSAAMSVGARRLFGVLQPLAPTRAFPPTGLGVSRLPRVLNRPLGRLTEIGGWRLVGPRLNRARQMRGQQPIPNPIPGIPTLCGWSPTLMPRPHDWSPEQFVVTGAWTIPPDPEWKPDPALAAFVAGGEPPIYVGFGSMPQVSSLPALLDVLLTGLAGRRVLVSSGWADLGVGSLPPDVHRVGFVPHEWLFPRCAAIVHHCGAGTTHAAAASGTPSIPVPFSVDQPFWAHRLRQLGIASAPIDARLPTVDAVRAALREVDSAAVRTRALEVASLLAQEDGVPRAVDAIEGLCAQSAGPPIHSSRHDPPR